MNRLGTVPICTDCMRLHRRLESNVRQERRKTLEAVITTQPALQVRGVRAYAAQLYDHLTLASKVRSGKDKTHPAPLPPADWTAQTLEAVDRVVLTVIHLWTGL